MSDLVPLAPSQPQEMRFQDQETGQWMIARVVDGKIVVVAERIGSQSPLSTLTQQMFVDAQDIFDLEMDQLLQEQLRGHESIRRGYQGKPLGKQRADREIYKFDRDTIRPKMQDLQRRQALRIEQAGHAAHQIAMKLAAAQAEQRITLAVLEEGAELRQLEGKVALDQAKSQVAVENVHDSRDKRLKEEELEREKKVRDEDHQRLAQLEKSRADNTIREAESKAKGELRMADLNAKKEIKVAKLKRKSSKDELRIRHEQEQRAWDREDQHRAEDGRIELVRRAQGMVKMLPFLESQFKLLEESGDAQIIQSAKDLLNAMSLDAAELAKAPPETQTEIAERYLNRQDKAWEIYLQAKLGKGDK